MTAAEQPTTGALTEDDKALIFAGMRVDFGLLPAVAQVKARGYAAGLAARTQPAPASPPVNRQTITGPGFDCHNEMCSLPSGHDGKHRPWGIAAPDASTEAVALTAEERDAAEYLSHLLDGGGLGGTERENREVRVLLYAVARLAALASDKADAKAGDVLRAAADVFESEYGDVWGGDVGWFTTGNKVAALVADRLRALATDHAAFADRVEQS